MRRAIILIFLVLFSIQIQAEDVNFKEMSLEDLQVYNTEGLDKKAARSHRKALKKATKKARKEARKNSPRAAYCSRAQKARGTCS